MNSFSIFPEQKGDGQLPKKRRGLPKGYWLSKEHRANHKGMLGKHHSEETIAKMRASHIGHYVSETTKGKISKSRRGIPVSDESRERYRMASKKRWSDPEYKEKQLRATAKSCANLTTKPERRLKNRLNHLFPNEYKYVGDGTFWIGGKNPDFVNTNGQKKIVEMFGTYWHSFAKTGRTKHQEKERRVKHFARYGFKTLIVWQNELKNIKQLRAKLIEFHNI